MITISSVSYQTPYHELLPPISEAENEVLKADIIQRGIIVPVVIDTERNVIDGHNRLRLAAELGIKDILFDIRVGLSEDEKRSLALDLNLHRRHLDKEQRGKYAVEMRRNGATYQAIGDKLGVSKSQIERDLSVFPNGKTESPPVINGKDGKHYPAKKKPRKSSVMARSHNEANQAISAMQFVAELPEGVLTLADVKREKKKIEHRERVEAVENAELPAGKYHVIVTDPPWSYGRQGDPTHRAANPYGQMTIEEIIADETVISLAHDDCVLWLWTTNAFMEEAYQVAKAWGFEVKTILTWVKDRMGTGDWLRGQTEHCLMCVQGKPVVNLTNQTTVIFGPLREHSRKPDEFYQLVDELCPGQKVELFSRQQRDGWAVYGNQTGLFR